MEASALQLTSADTVTRLQRATGGGNERLNTVPLPELPPCTVVPYSVFPNKINPPLGWIPSLLVNRVPEVDVKLCSVLKPVPLVLTANIVPAPELPPPSAVPYRVLPDTTTPANGLAPSRLV